MMCPNRLNKVTILHPQYFLSLRTKQLSYILYLIVFFVISHVFPISFLLINDVIFPQTFFVFPANDVFPAAQKDACWQYADCQSHRCVWIGLKHYLRRISE